MLPQQICRYIIGLSWIYHGIFPKLLHIAPVEKVMTASIGFSAQISYFITKFAGVGEVIWGLVFLVFYRNRTVALFNIAGLSGLLLFVIVMQPQFLIGAFNPVTTNIPLIGLSLILLQQQKKALK